MTHTAEPRVGAPSRAREVAFSLALVAAMAAGALVQFLIGALAPFIADDLDLSRAAVGGLTSALFASAAVLSLVAGRLVDRLGTMAMLSVLFAAVVTSAAGMAASPALPWLVAAVALGGIGLAVMNPVTNLLIARRVPPGRQGSLTGIKQSGVFVGSAAVGLLAPGAAAQIGWRAVLVGVALALALVGASAMRVVGRRGPAVRAPARPPGLPPPAQVRLGWLTAYALTMGAAVSAFGAFLVLYAVEGVGLPAPRAGAVLGLGSAVGIAARIAWGRAAERVASVAVPLALLAVLAAVGQALIWAAPSWPALLWAGTILYGASATAWNAVTMLAVIRGVPDGRTGRASGTVQAGFFVGFIVAPVAFGALVDATGGYDASWAATTGLFALAALIAGGWWRGERRAGRRGS
ncbi:MAG: MFS transporter [Actinomycetota bacterium]